MVKVIKVDRKDNFLGLIDKEKAHQGRGVLHRAFSIFIFNNKGELLLQKRSRFKKLWPLYWSNTCCSHPKIGETLAKAARRRLKEEMGFVCRLKPLFKFYYQATYQDIGGEHELCMVFGGVYNKKTISPDKKEVADYRWLDFKTLKKEIKEKGETFTPWFKKIIENKKFMRIIK